MCNSIMKELIKKFRNHDEGAFKLIYTVFERLINLYSARLYYEDGVSELTLFLIELLYKIDLSRFDSFQDTFSIQKYIAVSIRNKYSDLLKKSVERIKQTAPLLEISIPQSKNFDDMIMLPEAFALLSQKQKSVLESKYIYGYSDTEISQKMGITRQAVNSIKRRALAVLKSFYE